jgi:hypothetical protein
VVLQVEVVGDVDVSVGFCVLVSLKMNVLLLHKSAHWGKLIERDIIIILTLILSLNLLICILLIGGIRVHIREHLR